MQYYFRYIEGRYAPPSIPMLTGSATHKGAEITNISKHETGNDAPIDVIQDATRDEFVNRTKDEGVWLLNEEKWMKSQLLNDGLNDSISFATSYRNNFSKTHTKIQIVEKMMSADIGLDLPIVGKPDLISNDINEDMKVTGKRMPDGDEHLSLQPTFYKILARQNDCADMINYKSSYVILTKYKNEPRTEPYMWDANNRIAFDYRITERTDADELRLKQRLQVMISMIQAGTFMPAEIGHWICDPNRCAYWYHCKYAKR